MNRRMLIGFVRHVIPCLFLVFSDLAMTAESVGTARRIGPTPLVVQPQLHRADPNPAAPGVRVRISGSTLMPVGGGAVSSTIKYGIGPGAALAALPSSGWSHSGVSVRLPNSVTGGTIWLALYRNNEEVSNRLELRIQPAFRPSTEDYARVMMASRGLSEARVTDGPRCAGESTLRLRGGPFQPGTDSRAIGPYRWREGTTGVEVAVDGAADDNRFWNDLIYSVRVVSEGELEVRLGRCFVIQRNPRIRVIRPNGFRSNWQALRR